MDQRNQFQRFLLRNRNKGIPNLMLYIALGNAIVILLSFFNGGAQVYNLLCFDKTSILQGQVWRLVTYVFTQSSDGLLGLIFLYFFYLLGQHVEAQMGTLRFNLFYFSGMILMDVFAMIFSPVIPDRMVTAEEYAMLSAVIPEYASMGYYLHLSLVLLFATTHPDSQFMLFFFIPVKAWLMAAIYLFIELAAVFNLSYPVMYFPHNLFPLVALGNYLLFAGKNIPDLLPLSLRTKFRKKKPQKATGTIPFRPARQAAPNYTHRCCICGRTDVTHPQLEFRYCSRCAGYHCYCEDHINDHTHVQ